MLWRSMLRSLIDCAKLKNTFQLLVNTFMFPLVHLSLMVFHHRFCHQIISHLAFISVHFPDTYIDLADQSNYAYQAQEDKDWADVWSSSSPIGWQTTYQLEEPKENRTAWLRYALLPTSSCAHVHGWSRELQKSPKIEWPKTRSPWSVGKWARLLSADQRDCQMLLQARWWLFQVAVETEYYICLFLLCFLGSWPSWGSAMRDGYLNYWEIGITSYDTFYHLGKYVDSQR